MDTQEDLIKKQEEDRKKALEAQTTLSQKLMDDHRQQNEQIQRQQEQMRETQQRQQDALNQAATQALETQARQREIDQKPEGEGNKPVLDDHRERMEKSAEKSHDIAKQSEEVAKQLQDSQKLQARAVGVIENPDSADDTRKAAETLLEKANKDSQELQDKHAKLGKDFDSQSKMFDAYQTGFNQEHEQQNKLLNDRQEQLQAEQQRQAQVELERLNKASQDQLSKVAEDLEKRQAETLGAKWKNPEQVDDQGKKLENQQPNGQQFEDQLKKTGELNNKLAEVEKQRGVHQPYQEAQPQGKPALGDDEQTGKPKIDDPYAASNQLAEDAKLGKQSAGDLDGRHVRTPSPVDDQVNKVQDNWSQHERQQQNLIKEIRSHEKEINDLGKQLQENKEELSQEKFKNGPEAGCTPEDLKQFNALKKQQEDLAKRMNHADEQKGRKISEFKVNESDFQRQSWDRVAKMAELSGDKTLQQKAEMKSEAMKNQVNTMNQRLDEKYGPKPKENHDQESKDIKIMSEGEINNKLKPVSPGGVSEKIVEQAKEQKQAVETREAARLSDELSPKIKQGRVG